MSELKLHKLTAGYGGKPILSDISFQLGSGHLMGILGPNGCGKTTLLKSICGILPFQGDCQLEGMSLKELSARKMAQLCSYIPQRSGISIDISVLDVVLMGFNPRLGLLQHPTPAMKEKARQALVLAGLKGMEQRNYMYLSEGQKQLCILARTIVTDSRLLLLDEPESALDFRFRYQMLRRIRKWIQEGQRMALITLHDPVLALNECDELLLLKDGGSAGVIHPRTDPLDEMQTKLTALYGPVSLITCRDAAGKEHLVMLKVEEEP